MRLDVRLFAGLRERAGTERLAVELPDRATVDDLLAALADTALRDLPARSFIVAVNRAYALPGQTLDAGDEVALVPPVSGGAGAVRHVALREEPLDPAALLDKVRDPRAGAVVLFEGATRDVTHLDYEAYAEMAVPLVTEIGEQEAARYGLTAVAVEHRVGRVPLSEAAVLVAVSAPHRAEAFAGAQAVMDRIKAQAPIFKREEGAWIGALPDGLKEQGDGDPLRDEPSQHEA